MKEMLQPLKKKLDWLKKRYGYFGEENLFSLYRDSNPESSSP